VAYGALRRLARAWRASGCGENARGGCGRGAASAANFVGKRCRFLPENYEQLSRVFILPRPAVSSGKGEAWQAGGRRDERQPGGGGSLGGISIRALMENWRAGTSRQIRRDSWRAAWQLALAQQYRSVAWHVTYRWTVWAARLPKIPERGRSVAYLQRALALGAGENNVSAWRKLQLSRNSRTHGAVSASDEISAKAENAGQRLAGLGVARSL